MHSPAHEEKTPRVSIGLPVYNGDGYLEEAITSILSQSFDDLELIISDNASTDRTEEICRRFAAQDERVHYHRLEQNEGAAPNYNKVFELARGEFFKWAAHDDLCLPDFVELCVAALDRAPPSVVLAYPGSRYIDGDGRDLGPDTDDMRVHGGSPHSRLRRCLATVNMAGPVFGLIRSDVLRCTRLIDSFIASDYVLIAELGLLGDFVQLPEMLFLRRIHQESSREANKDDDDVLAWFDPKRKSNGRLSVRQRLMLEYARSVRRLVRPALERALCLAVIPATMAERRVRVVGGRWKRIVKRRVLGAAAGGTT